MTYQVNVLVADKRLDTYVHEGDTFIEGRDGSDYVLELVNPTNTDAEFVVSVDGLSINDGKVASKQSSGYIVPAYGTARIKGWLLDNASAAKFTFGAKQDSYSAESGQGVQNVGVIGLQVFRKKAEYVNPNAYWNSINITYTAGKSPTDASWCSTPMFGSSVSDVAGYNGASIAGAGPKSRRITLNAVSKSAESAASHTLGTEFGEKTEMRTTTVSFDRASVHPAFTKAIYYGNARDLNKRGITLNWQRKSLPSKPSAFPADDPNYCAPPKNWRG